MFALTAPIPFVPFISIFNWPLGVAALLTGWKGSRHARIVGDRTGVWRARWGIGLGCLGWTVQLTVSTIKVILITGLLVSGLSWLVEGLSGLQATPSPTPAPTRLSPASALVDPCLPDYVYILSVDRDLHRQPH
jgi:hypothetical protein